MATKITYTKHFYDRAIERHGKKVDQKKIVDDIKNNRAIYISKGKLPGTSVWAVIIDRNIVPVVYSKKSSAVVTIMHKPYILQQLKKRLIGMQYEK